MKKRGRRDNRRKKKTLAERKAARLRCTAASLSLYVIDDADDDCDCEDCRRMLRRERDPAQLELDFS